MEPAPLWQNERNERILCNARGHNLSSNRVEVSSGQEVSLASVGASCAAEELEQSRKTDS